MVELLQKSDSMSNGRIADELSTLQVERGQRWADLVQPTTLALMSLVDQSKPENGKLNRLLIPKLQKKALLDWASERFPEFKNETPQDDWTDPAKTARLYFSFLKDYKGSAQTNRVAPGMFRSLSSFVSNAADLLVLEVEELAELLLLHLRSYEGVSVYQNGLISQRNFVDNQTRPPEFGSKQPEVDRALMAAWAWLVSQGLLVKDPSQPAPWFFISRRGQRLNSHDEFADYRKGEFLPTRQLHPLIAAEVYPAFCAANMTPQFLRHCVK